MISKKIIAVILAGALILSLAACQTAEAGQEATDNNLESLIAMANRELPDDTKALSALAQRMGAPLHYNDEFTAHDGNLKVSIDADVDVPESDAIKVLKVETSDFTQDTADKLMAALLHGQLYECLEEGVFNTKADIQARMDAYDAAGQEYDRSLQYWYDAAPAEKTPISGTFNNPSYTNGLGEWKVAQNISQIQGLAQSDAGYEALTVINSNKGLGNQLMYRREPNEGFLVDNMARYCSADEISVIGSSNMKATLPCAAEQMKSITDVSITEEEAVAQADALVKKIGADSFTCCSAEKVYGGCWDVINNSYGTGNPLRCVWRLRYARTVNGIQATYTDERCGAVREEDIDPNDSCKSNGLNDPWSYEEMTICIDDSGVTDFYWQSPYNVTGTSVEDANVITFDNAMNVFKTMIPVKNIWFSSGNKGEIKITGIKFGLARITEETDRDSGILVPVWDFFGTIIFDTENGKGIMEDYRPEQSLLTINAIDGSIIDRSYGY